VNDLEVLPKIQNKIPYAILTLTLKKCTKPPLLFPPKDSTPVEKTRVL
jgi:hypothetical protein